MIGIDKQDIIHNLNKIDAKKQCWKLLQVEDDVVLTTSSQDISNGGYTITEDGTYLIIANVCFSNAPDQDKNIRYILLSLYKDSTELSSNYKTLHHAVSSNREYITISIAWQGELVTDEVLTLQSLASVSSDGQTRADTTESYWTITKLVNPEAL